MSRVHRVAGKNGTSALGSESGAIILFVAIGLVVLVGMMGLAIDVGHAYVNKSHLQNIADACALAGASALNGTAAGIVLAETRATDASSYLDNRTEFNKDQVTVPASAVEYSAVSPDGPWMARGTAEGVASTIRYVRVIVPPRDSEIIFAKVVPGIPGVMNFGARAVAGRQPVTEMCTGLDPFSPVAIDLNDHVNWGFNAGQVYTIRLDPGNSSGGTTSSCGAVGIPGPGSTTGNFGFAEPSHSGNASVPTFENNLLNGGYSGCTSVGTGALPADSGLGGGATLSIIEDRFNQDADLTNYPEVGPTAYGEFGTYLSRTVNHGSQSYRRIIRVAFNDNFIPPGTSDPYNVVGFGCFWMPRVPTVHPPSDAICLIYIGGCDISGMPTGGGASITRTVLFR